MTDRPKLRWAARIVYALAALFVLVPAGLLVVHGETLAARLAGLFTLPALALPPMLPRVLSSRKRQWLAAGTAAVAACLFLWIVLLAPPGEGSPGSRVRSHFPGPASYRRFAVANLVPEIDQIKLGTYLIPLADPIITLESAAHLREVSMALYRPMEADPEFRALGSVMNYAYDNEPSGHFYEYVPEHAPEERLPVLIFLHGSMGNFRSYFYIWRRFADEHHFIVLCPSFGWGNWYEPGGIEAIERVRSHAMTKLPSDPARVYLAGLSNGGTGATRAAASNPSGYAGLIFLSAVMEPEVIESESFRRGWANRPILVIHGARDDRIPLAHAEHAAAQLRAMGAHLTYKIYPDEDHFLVFAKVQQTLTDVATWTGQGASDGLHDL
jgi:phospholipase/carboxylesterase